MLKRIATQTHMHLLQHKHTCTNADPGVAKDGQFLFFSEKPVGNETFV